MPLAPGAHAHVPERWNDSTVRGRHCSTVNRELQGGRPIREWSHVGQGNSFPEIYCWERRAQFRVTSERQAAAARSCASIQVCILSSEGRSPYAEGASEKLKKLKKSKICMRKFRPSRGVLWDLPRHPLDEAPGRPNVGSAMNRRWHFWWHFALQFRAFRCASMLNIDSSDCG